MQVDGTFRRSSWSSHRSSENFRPYCREGGRAAHSLVINFCRRTFSLHFLLEEPSSRISFHLCFFFFVVVGCHSIYFRLSFSFVRVHFSFLFFFDYLWILVRFFLFFVSFYSFPISTFALTFVRIVFHLFCRPFFHVRAWSSSTYRTHSTAQYNSAISPA